MTERGKHYEKRMGVGWHAICIYCTMVKPFRPKLFGDIYLEETPSRTLQLYKGSDKISPHEYAYIWQLTPNAYALGRTDKEKLDIVFSNGLMFLGSFYAHTIGAVGENEEKCLIAVLVANGTIILDDTGHYVMFISGFPRINTLHDAFIVVYQPDGTIPTAKVYDLDGKMVAEGLPLEVREAAHKRLRGE